MAEGDRRTSIHKASLTKPPAYKELERVDGLVGGLLAELEQHKLQASVRFDSLVDECVVVPCWRQSVVVKDDWAGSARSQLQGAPARFCFEIWTMARSATATVRLDALPPRARDALAVVVGNDCIAQGIREAVSGPKSCRFSGDADPKSGQEDAVSCRCHSSAVQKGSDGVEHLVIGLGDCQE